jgi:hypothetical protein
METPRMAATISARSEKRPTRSALTEPRIVAVTSQMIPAGMTSDSVTGNFCLNWSTTLRSSW